MKNVTRKQIWIVALALMAFAAVFDTVKTARADDPITPVQVVKPGRR